MAGYRPVKIAYKAFEPAGGSNDELAPVIFLHGSTCSKEMWDDIPQIIANKTKRKAYVYDARSHGESESSEHYNFDLNVDDLFHFMDGLDIKKAVLVGHSMGGLTATNSALRKPDRVEMVFSEDMFIKKIPAEILDAVSKHITVWAEVVHSLPKDLKESDALAHAVDILYEKNKETETFTSKESLKNSKLILKRKADGGYDINFDKDPMIKAFKNSETLFTSPSGEFNGPAYFLYGGDSPFNVGSEESHIKKHFPKAELIEFEGASHSFHMEFKEKFVQTILNRLHYKPIKIAYKTFEPAGGSNDELAPVIFLHGSTCSKEIWDDIPQIIANKTKRKAYAYDARSHGESESSEHYNFDLNVDDLFHFMDGLDIKKAILVGHSMGGHTATNSALRKPDRVEIVFSVDMFVKKIPAQIIESSREYMKVWAEIVHSLPKDLKESDAFNQAVDILFEKNKENAIFKSKEILKKSKLLLKRKADGGYDVNFDKDPLIKAYKNPETLMSSPSGEFNGPAYFIYGGDSPFDVGSEESHIKKHFPKAELIEFEGASHCLHVEFPEKFVETILSRL